MKLIVVKALLILAISLSFVCQANQVSAGRMILHAQSAGLPSDTTGCRRTDMREYRDAYTKIDCTLGWWRRIMLPGFIPPGVGSEPALTYRIWFMTPDDSAANDCQWTVSANAMAHGAQGGPGMWDVTAVGLGSITEIHDSPTKVYVTTLSAPGLVWDVLNQVDCVGLTCEDLLTQFLVELSPVTTASQCDFRALEIRW